MTEEEDILRLRNEIPDFECIPGCTDCCGIVSWSPWEWNQVFVKKQHKVFKCPYVADNHGCSVYNDRPIPCRLFGTVNRLPCPHGRRPSVMLTEEQDKKITDTYQSHEPKASNTVLKGLNEADLYSILMHD